MISPVTIIKLGPPDQGLTCNAKKLLPFSATASLKFSLFLWVVFLKAAQVVRQPHQTF